MAISILSNKKGVAATVHVNGSNTIVIAGNSSISTIATGNEVLTGASISQVFWGTDAGSIQISRGGSVVAVYNNTGHHDYAGTGLALTLNDSANVDISFNATANGFIMLELQKIGNLTANSEYFQI